jgi:hypothetical protein
MQKTIILEIVNSNFIDFQKIRKLNFFKSKFLNKNSAKF